MRTGSQAPGFVLWPPTFDLQRGSSGIEVVDGQGNLVAGVGEPVQLGGGWMHLSSALSLTDGRVPEACRVDGERYFIASPGIGWELDGVTLLRGRTGSLSGDQALAEGRLGERNGCVALLDEAGDGPYLVWPRLYLLTDGPTGFLVRNGEDDRIFAAAGETLHIGGSIGSVEDPRALPGGIPDACQDRGAEYWFVGERLPAG